MQKNILRVIAVMGLGYMIVDIVMSIRRIRKNTAEIRQLKAQLAQWDDETAEGLADAAEYNVEVINDRTRVLRPVDIPTDEQAVSAFNEATELIESSTDYGWAYPDWITTQSARDAYDDHMNMTDLHARLSLAEAEGNLDEKERIKEEIRKLQSRMSGS